VPDPVEVDHAGMGLGAVADQIGVRGPQIHRKAQALFDHRRLVDQRGLRMQGGKRGIVQRGLSAAKADLVETHAGTDQHRERARTDLGIERAAVSGRHAVEFGAAVDHGAGQQVEPAGRALCIGRGGDVVRQCQPFGQRHEIDAALFQYRAPVQRKAVHFQFVQPVGHGSALARQKRRPHPVRDPAQAQIERGGLDLAGVDRGVGGNRPVGQKPLDLVIAEQAGHGVSAATSQRQNAGIARILVGLAGLEPATFRPPDGRATRLRHSPNLCG
jgi:hypothetical protein